MTIDTIRNELKISQNGKQRNQPKTENYLYLDNLNKLEVPRQEGAGDNDEANESDNAKEPTQALTVSARNRYIHAPETANEIHGDQQTGNEGHLAQDLVDVITQDNVAHVQLGEVVAMRAAQHLLKMSQVGHHGNNVILNVTQVQADVTPRSNRVLLVATFGKPFDNVGLAAEKTHQTHDFLA
jgi:hypothetical protein